MEQTIGETHVQAKKDFCHQQTSAINRLPSLICSRSLNMDFQPMGIVATHQRDIYTLHRR